MEMLKDKRIVLGVSGSIAVYKAVDMASKLAQAGALVDVVMTEGALEFVTPLSFRSVTHRSVLTKLFDADSELSLEHVALAERVDAVVVAPATANLMAKVANGLADDLLTCILLAVQAPVILAPAMDGHMYDNPATQENASKLRARGFILVGPVHGRLASGLVGMGRLAEVDEIIATIKQALGRKGDLAGRRIVVTAGGTREPIDPVRHIGNRSSGKMGYAVAEAARDRGGEVVLVTSPTSLPDPVGMRVVKAETALEMRGEVLKAVAKADVLLMASAVADYRPKEASDTKIKKNAETITLTLVRTPDILSEVQGDLVKVGFAAESDNLVENAQKKLKEKHLDLIVANDVTAAGSGFASDTNRVVLIERRGKVEQLPLMSKGEVAHRILDRVAKMLPKRA